MCDLTQAYTAVAFIFNIPLVFIGAFFLLNLTLAVIQSKYSKEHDKKNEDMANKIHRKKKGQVMDFDNLDEAEKSQLIEK